MKLNLKFLTILLFFGSNVFGYNFYNRTKFNIEIVLQPEETKYALIAPNSKVVLNEDQIKSETKVLESSDSVTKPNIFKVVFGEVTWIIDLPENGLNIYFKQSGKYIFTTDDKNNELGRIALIESESEEEESDDKSDKLEVKKGGLFTFRNIAIIAVLGTAGYFAWDYYKKSQKNDKK